MTSENCDRIDQCHARFDNIDETLRDVKTGIDQLHSKMFVGNGGTSVMVEIDRLKTFKRVVCWFGSIVAIALVTVVVRLLFL